MPGQEWLESFALLWVCDGPITLNRRPLTSRIFQNRQGLPVGFAPLGIVRCVLPGAGLTQYSWSLSFALVELRQAVAAGGIGWQWLPRISNAM
jgi:hypothetical protein